MKVRRREGNTLNHFPVFLPLSMILDLTSFPIASLSEIAAVPPFSLNRAIQFSLFLRLSQQTYSGITKLVKLLISTKGSLIFNRIQSPLKAIIINTILSQFHRNYHFKVNSITKFAIICVQ